MKVILIKQVDKLGVAGDVVDVASGYGRNFLIAKGLAQEATSDAIIQAQSSKQKKEKKKSDQEKKINKLKSALENQTILVRASSNKEGHLFGGVGPKEIAQAISKRKKINIDPKQIKLAHHFKALGIHEVVLQLSGDNKTKFTVDIQSSNE
ncbi:50S ribosomal protein L9 [bacterium]|jgi:large subunit ribosomal protein L9|nr:50S ribosomal protein L9 [bacterium]MDP6571764.1 50S ribosomal protein L9 [Patescibacteria group bacterium]|tara:strand:- start:5684 stop:6136 length:453 start_codon:yes stop_codon:yes gene_type:complete